MASKETVVQSLRELQEGLVSFSRIIQNTTTVQVAPEVFVGEVDYAVAIWADRVEQHVTKFGVDEAVAKKYRDGLRKLHSLSSKRNLRKSHQRVMKDLLKDFHADLVQPVMFHGGADPSAAIKKIIAYLPYPYPKGDRAESLILHAAVCAP